MNVATVTPEVVVVVIVVKPIEVPRPNIRLEGPITTRQKYTEFPRDRKRVQALSRLVCFWQQRISEVAQTSKAADWPVIAASVAHTPKCTAGYPAVAVAPAPREEERGPVEGEAPRLQGTRSRSCCKSGASAPGGGYNNARHVALRPYWTYHLTPT